MGVRPAGFSVSASFSRTSRGPRALTSSCDVCHVDVAGSGKVEALNLDIALIPAELPLDSVP